MIRNARFSAANNRIYRPAPGSIDEAIQNFQQAVGKGKGEAYLIPEYVDRFPIIEGQKRLGKLPVEKLRASKALPSVDRFVDCCAPGGKLYHGTPSLESGLAIVRGGLFISKKNQGTALYGRGGYTSPDVNVARQVLSEYKIRTWTQMDQFIPEFFEILIEKGFHDPTMKDYLTHLLTKGGYTDSVKVRPSDISRRVAAALDRIGGLDASVIDALVTARGPFWKQIDADSKLALIEIFDRWASHSPGVTALLQEPAQDGNAQVRAAAQKALAGRDGDCVERGLRGISP